MFDSTSWSVNVLALHVEGKARRLLPRGCSIETGVFTSNNANQTADYVHACTLVTDDLHYHRLDVAEIH